MSKDKTHFIHDRVEFDSFEEFLECVSDKPTQAMIDAWGKGRYKGVRRLESVHGTQAFTGTRSYKHALKLAHEGWSEGREQFDHLMSKVTPYVQAAVTQPSVDYGPAGYLPNIPLYCSGDPAYMQQTGETYAQQAPVIKIQICMSISGTVEKEYIMNRAAAICALVDYFEATGTQCEIELAHAAEDGGTNPETEQPVKILHECFIPVKRAGEFVEPDRLAFMLGHPSVLRRFVFRIDEQCVESGPYMRWGYGMPKDIERDADAVYFPAMLYGSGYYSPKAALETALERVREALDDRALHRVTEDWGHVLTDDRGAAY